MLDSAKVSNLTKLKHEPPLFHTILIITSKQNQMDITKKLKEHAETQKRHKEMLNQLAEKEASRKKRQGQWSQYVQVRAEVHALNNIMRVAAEEQCGRRRGEGTDNISGFVGNAV